MFTCQSNEASQFCTDMTDLTIGLNLTPLCTELVEVFLVIFSPTCLRYQIHSEISHDLKIKYLGVHEWD